MCVFVVCDANHIVHTLGERCETWEKAHTQIGVAVFFVFFKSVLSLPTTLAIHRVLPGHLPFILHYYWTLKVGQPRFGFLSYFYPSGACGNAGASAGNQRTFLKERKKERNGPH